MLLEMFKEGGWPMWPLLLLGLATLASASIHAARPSQPLRQLYRGLVLTMLLGGVIGTWLNTVYKSYAGHYSTALRWVAFEEASNCMFLALNFVAGAVLFGTVGNYRLCKLDERKRAAFGSEVV